MKTKSDQDHLSRLLTKLENRGLNQVHAAMAENLIRFSIRGPLEYTKEKKTALLTRIARYSPALVADVKALVENAGGGKIVHKKLPGNRALFYIYSLNSSNDT
jgi:hypothetical protein